MYGTRASMEAIVKQQPKSGKLFRHPKGSYITPEEEVRIARRRMEKAERDERMDITATLTPPKTYMGGFTRPRDLRASNWFPGGPYLLKGKHYLSPHEDAYKPHTVFIAETRYNVRQGIGRVDCKDHIVDVCRTEDWHKLVQRLNCYSPPREYRESLDNACWPWVPHSGKVLKPVRWWDQGEDMEKLMKEIYEDPDYRLSPELAELFGMADTDEGDFGTEPPQKPYQPKKKRDLVSLFIEPRDPSEKSKPRIFKLKEIRKAYLPRIREEPFWRPLIAVGLSTRPLALSLSRLSKALERGLAFYASISNDDRKCLISYDSRMRSLRLQRIRQLTLDICQRLAGYKGGFIGIRFDTERRGRGVDGEGLADPIPPHYRIVDVKIADWYTRAQEEAELYRAGVAEYGAKDALRAPFMNDWGQTLDENKKPIPWDERQTAEQKLFATRQEKYTGAEDFADENLPKEYEDEGICDEDEDDDVEEQEEKEEEEESEEITAEEESPEDETLEWPDDEKVEWLEEESEEELLKHPYAPRPVGAKKIKYKPAFYGNSPQAAALRRKLAYRLAGGHKSVLRL